MPFNLLDNLVGFWTRDKIGEISIKKEVFWKGTQKSNDKAEYCA